MPKVGPRKVKTEKEPEHLPYLRFVHDKYWSTPRPSGSKRSASRSHGTPLFEARYFQLLDLYGIELADERQVYFLGWEGGPVKIGVAGDMAARLTTLQTACPYRIRIEALAKGGVPTEREYHKRFASSRLHGEWFERCPEIEAEIERLSQWVK